MIAADFGHPHSTYGFYVATRFFDREYKTCMPGFILAFAEQEVLAEAKPEPKHNNNIDIIINKNL